MDAASPPADGPQRGEPERFGLPREWRVRSGAEIRSLMKRGERERTPSLDVFSAASPSSFPRFGLVVPKYGRRIVDRNRLKRRLRELARSELLPRLRQSGPATDVLVRTRPEAYDAGYDGLREELVSWVERRR